MDNLESKTILKFGMNLKKCIHIYIYIYLDYKIYTNIKLFHFQSNFPSSYACFCFLSNSSKDLLCIYY